MTYMYAIKCFAYRLMRTIAVISFLVIALNSNKQTQGFGRVVRIFAIPALVAGEVALLSQKVIKSIQSILLGHFEK